MAYRELAAMRLKDAMTALGAAEIVTKRMMGGVILMTRGHMLCGTKTLASGAEEFMFRVGKGHMDEALSLPGTRPMFMRDKPMPGFLFAEEPDLTPDDFDRLCGLAMSFVASLPSKA